MRTNVTAMPIASPPPITFEATAGIVKRHNDNTDSFVGSDWATRSKAHCRLMATMSDDKRIQYLGTAGCDDDTIRLITRAVAVSVGKDAKPALRSAARECAKAEEDIESLLERWPEAQHFQLLSSRIAHLDAEHISLSSAYAACQIYETAATSLYLAIMDGMDPVVTKELSDVATSEQDRAIADAGYTDEVALWPE